MQNYRPGQKRILFFTAAAIIAATFVAYEPVRKNDFVDYDDTRYITKNPDVKCGISWRSLGRAFTKPHFHMWHPLTTISHILDCQLFGLNPAGHHLVSLSIHIANALLLFLILTNMTSSIWPSAFVAAVFALHPLQVEAVAWAAERKTVLSGLFWLLTTAAYIHYTRQQRLRRYLLLLLVYGLCIMTKPVVVTLPLALLLLDYWPLGRIGGQNQKLSKGWLIAEKVPLLVLSGILSMTTFVSQRHGGAVTTLERIPLDSRIANMFISYISYVGKMLWPSRLAVFYPYHYAKLPMIKAIICGLLFVLISALCIYIGRRRKYAATGWLWYAGTLVPVIGLVQSGSQAMANRYMYMPMVGLLIIIAWAVKDLVASRPRFRTVTVISAMIVLSSVLILTRMQVKNWENSERLFGYALQVTENNPVAEKGYGCAMFAAGRFDEAIIHLSNAVRINPEYYPAVSDLGKAYLKAGKPGEAEACFKGVLKQIKDSAELYYDLGLALNMQRKYDEAVKCFSHTLELDPQYPDAHNRMGVALLAMGQNSRAIWHLKEALRTGPREPKVYENLGSAFFKSGGYEQAIQNWTKAVELQTDNIETFNNLAWLLATTGDVSAEDANKAVGFAEHACILAGYKEPGFLDTLAVAYAAAGRFEEAVKTAQKAIDAAKALGQDELAGEIEKRKRLYQAGKPYIQE